MRVFPSTDRAFVLHVREIAATEDLADPKAFQARLRRFHPRAIVQARVIGGEGDVWYVYRDGRWGGSIDTWWLQPHVGRLAVSTDGGWLVDADGIARGILALEPDDLGQTHFSDLIAPGTLGDAERLFAIIASGEPFEGTVVVRPRGGEPIAVDLHVVPAADRLAAAIRLAADIPPIDAMAVPRPASLECRPADDEAFAGYARALLDRMPEPTTEGLAMRLRRIYPHATVRAEADVWVVRRESDLDGTDQAEPGWWRLPGLPRVAFDAQGLITEANAEAQRLLGSPLVGHHWHELVTAGTTDAVDAVIDAIREAGGAVSRFRMPDGSGSLVEFDCYTTVQADGLMSILRPLTDPRQRNEPG